MTDKIGSEYAGFGVNTQTHKEVVVKIEKGEDITEGMKDAVSGFLTQNKDGKCIMKKIVKK